MEPAEITMRLVDGNTEYKIFGYTVRGEKDGKPTTELYHADRRRTNPVMVVPVENIAEITAVFK
jgi:hypothetical protein